MAMGNIIDKILQNSFLEHMGKYGVFGLSLKQVIPNVTYDVYFKTRWDVEIFKDSTCGNLPIVLLPKDLEDTASIESEGAGMALFDGLSLLNF